MQNQALEYSRQQRAARWPGPLVHTHMPRAVCDPAEPPEGSRARIWAQTGVAEAAAAEAMNFQILKNLKNSSKKNRILD